MLDDRDGEASVLGRVEVRPLREEERSEFDWRLQEQHYLASSVLVGESLRYVAEIDGQWVALLAFSAPALHLKGRELWIRWSARQRARRLGFVVKRFVLPDRALSQPGLARPGPVFAAAVCRLAGRWGHPVLVVESFVAEPQYRGPATGRAV
jgi:hypothetical protein